MNIFCEYSTTSCLWKSIITSLLVAIFSIPRHLFKMNPWEVLQTMGRHLFAVFWIYLRFIVLAVVIFYLVEWYIREYDDGGADASSEGAQNSTRDNIKKDEL